MKRAVIGNETNPGRFLWTQVRSNVALPPPKTANLHTDKYFRNLIKSTRNNFVFTMQQLIWFQTVVRFDPNQSENAKYNLISV